jgi:hypothetical protein
MSIEFVGVTEIEAGAVPKGTKVAVERLTDGSDLQSIELYSESAGIKTKIGPVNPMPVSDRFTGGEVLPDQSGAGAVLTFTFASAVHLIWVLSQGADLVARVDPFGGVPSAVAGIPVFEQAATAIVVTATTIKVYAPVGTTISVWGFR